MTGIEVRDIRGTKSCTAQERGTVAELLLYIMYIIGKQSETTVVGSISRTRSCPVTDPVSVIRTPKQSCPDKYGRADVTCYGTSFISSTFLV